MEKEYVSNYLRYGEYGDFAEMDGRKAVRIARGTNTVPTCRLYENGKFLRDEDSFSETMNFLYGGNTYEKSMDS